MLDIRYDFLALSQDMCDNSCACRIRSAKGATENMKIHSRKWGCVVVATALAIFPLASNGARSVDWPAAYETQIASRIAETTPSGGNVGTSVAFAGFDSVLELMFPAYFEVLRNSRVPGFTLSFL